MIYQSKEMFCILTSSYNYWNWKDLNQNVVQLLDNGPKMRQFLYKLLGLFHLLLGTIQVSFVTWSFFVGEPGLRAFYEGMDIYYRTGFIWYAVLLIAAAIDFIFSYKLLKKKNGKLLFIASFIFLFLSFFLFFIVGFGKYSNVGVSGFPPEVAKPF